MLSHCAWFPSRVFQPRRYRPGNIGNWSGHLPFAHDLIEAVRPACFVELGTHFGESYFGFCQAIAENNIQCTAYAVDTWEGEAHAGFYGTDVYEDVAAYNQANYSNFSYLLRSLFDDAVSNFGDNSIDILHIDGLHTFDAVSHDFYNWLPKVKPGGIVLLHDVCARHLDFGVWKLWEKLQSEGQTFAFHHSWGLGVFRKPGSPLPESDLLKALFESDATVKAQLRRYYSLAALELEAVHQRKGSDAAPFFQIFVPSTNGYEESHSQTFSLTTDEWQCIRAEIPEGIAAGRLRIDPIDRPAVIEIRGIDLVSPVDQKSLWRSTRSDLAQLECQGTLVRLPTTDANEAGRFFSYGVDPQLYVPSLDGNVLDQPLTMQIWLRVRTNLDALPPLLTETPGNGKDESEELHRLYEAAREFQTELQTVKTQLEAGARERESFQSEIEKHQADRAQLLQEINEVRTRLYILEGLEDDLKHENTNLEQQFGSLDKEYTELRQTYTALETAYSQLNDSHRNTVQERDSLRETLDGILRSRSWRLTAPIRGFSESFRKN